jgi:hypothetical protein
MRWLLLLFTLLSSLAAFVDNDLDGVDDQFDQCLQSDLFDLVDATGCSTKTLISPHHFKLSTALTYSKLDQENYTLTKTRYHHYTLEYSYRQWQFFLSTATYHTSETDAQSDTTLGAAYTTTPSPALSLTTSLSIIFPTYTPSSADEAIDLSIYSELAYTVNDLTFFQSIGYTLIRDHDNPELTASYQNSRSSSTGIGYELSPQLYTTLSYSFEEPIYQTLTTIQMATISLYYTLNDHFTLSTHYAKGYSNTTSDYNYGVGLIYAF